LYSFLILRKDAEACEDAGAVLIVALEIFVVGFLAVLLVRCFFGFVFVAVVDDEPNVDVDVDDDASSKGGLLLEFLTVSKDPAEFDAVLVTAGTTDDGFSSDEATTKNVSKRAEKQTTLPFLRRTMVSRVRD
jgi:hypothetical protein